MRSQFVAMDPPMPSAEQPAPLHCQADVKVP